jgi:hypothetical protein
MGARLAAEAVETARNSGREWYSVSSLKRHLSRRLLLASTAKPASATARDIARVYGVAGVCVVELAGTCYESI